MHSHYVVTSVSGTMSQRLLCLSLQDAAPGLLLLPTSTLQQICKPACVLSLSGASPPALWALSQLGDEEEITGIGRGS